MRSLLDLVKGQSEDARLQKFFWKTVSAQSTSSDEKNTGWKILTAKAENKTSNDN